jgi:hypothetical protein
MRTGLLIVGLTLLALISAVRADDVTVRWTIQADDPSTPDNGPATGYTLYLGPDSAAVVDAARADEFDTTGVDWQIVDHLAVPGAVGDTVTYVVTGLLPEVEYFFTMKSLDNAGNRSLLGNIVKYRIEDTERPGVVNIEIY